MIALSPGPTWILVVGWILASIVFGLLIGKFFRGRPERESVAAALGFTRWERFTHKVGWHSPLEPIDGDRMGQFRCLQCGKVGLVDSQGNLF